MRPFFAIKTAYIRSDTPMTGSSSSFLFFPRIQSLYFISRFFISANVRISSFFVCHVFIFNGEPFSGTAQDPVTSLPSSDTPYIPWCAPIFHQWTKTLYRMAISTSYLLPLFATTSTSLSAWYTSTAEQRGHCRDTTSWKNLNRKNLRHSGHSTFTIRSATRAQCSCIMTPPL